VDTQECSVKLKRCGKYRNKFDVLFASRSVQAAVMTLAPGDTSDDELSNEHPRSEQWLFVIAGTGHVRATSAAKRTRTKQLRAGDVLLIEKGERHQVKNTGKRAFRTINFYAPPAYDDEGEVKPSAKRG
jgi:mannose-6-phosphate isomerase-like protein (cupin superfamily)